MDPIRPPDDEARRLARSLLASPHAALAYTDPATGTPGIGRVALALDGQGVPVTLVSDLSAHGAALAAHPDCALLLGEPGAKGDPLTHPRLMLRARAAPADRAELRALWLARHPKAKLYVDFADFRFLRLVPQAALLNAGFGRAHRIAPEDLLP